MIKESDYKDCLEYIQNYWPKITSSFKKDKEGKIGLPNKFITPSDVLFKDDQFYWDSYFTILGLMVSGKEKLAKGMVENFAHLYERFAIMPMRNMYFNLGTSQPPFFTSMVLEVFGYGNLEHKKRLRQKDKLWLKKMVQLAEKELKNYWMDTRHNAFQDLSRYCDQFWTHTTAEHESGWDMTSRFDEECMDYLPIDLNCLLYKYENDIAAIYKLLGNRKKSKAYLQAADARGKKINQLMWNEKKGFFFDFNYKKEQQSHFYSLAGFYPMWCGLATEDQAKKCLKALKFFETVHGLTNTQKIKSPGQWNYPSVWPNNQNALFKGLLHFGYRRAAKVFEVFMDSGTSRSNKNFKQWDWPNGWANNNYIVIKGLANYGYRADAERLALKWLELNKRVFEKTGKFWEAYNVVEGHIGKESRYPIQTGFGWTNAVFVRLIKEFSD